MLFFVVNFDIDFDLQVISGEAISKFSGRLAADPTLAQQFLANRIGYAQLEKTEDLSMYLCQQMQSMYKNEID